MKTENTPEEKAKFFAKYFMQSVFRNKHWIESEPNEAVSTYILNTKMELSEGYLLHTPLKNISDEDAIEVADIILGMDIINRYKTPWKVSRDFTVTGYPYIMISHPKNVYRVQIDCALVNFDIYDMEDCITSSHDMKPYAVIDFLRSKSYLLPYKDLSTEDLIAYGWAKES